MVVGISGYVGNRLTGIGRVLVNVVRELSAQNPGDVYYIFKNDDYDGFSQLEGAQNVRLVNTGVSKESGMKNLLWHQYGFQRMLKKYSCDIAYIPNFSLLLWKVVPTAVTIHDLIEFNVPGKFGKMRMFYRKNICDPPQRCHTYGLGVIQEGYCQVPEGTGVQDYRYSQCFRRLGFQEVPRR